MARITTNPRQPSRITKPNATKDNKPTSAAGALDYREPPARASRTPASSQTLTREALQKSFTHPTNSSAHKLRIDLWRAENEAEQRRLQAEREELRAKTQYRAEEKRLYDELDKLQAREKHAAEIRRLKAELDELQVRARLKQIEIEIEEEKGFGRGQGKSVLTPAVHK